MMIAETYRNDLSGTELSACSKAILKTLLYFDIFHFPLPVADIYKYAPGAISDERIESQLTKLEGQGLVKRHSSFYCLAGCNAEEYSGRREEGAKKAEKLLQTAMKFSKFISYFPFVQGICLSGSLSKGYADKKSDIDYFIITTPGRLWLCRTMLIAFKKLFLFNSHKYFCVNYFVDTDNLEIPDKNIFVATELSSLIPAYNATEYERLMQYNTWIKTHHPNFNLKEDGDILPENKSMIKKIGEKMFGGKLGEWLDEKCFKITLLSWRRKFDHFDDNQFDLRLRSRKNVSKHHPNGFQERILKEYEKKIHEFEKAHNVSLA